MRVLLWNLDLGVSRINGLARAKGVYEFLLPKAIWQLISFINSTLPVSKPAWCLLLMMPGLFNFGESQ